MFRLSNSTEALCHVHSVCDNTRFTIRAFVISVWKILIQQKLTLMAIMQLHLFSWTTAQNGSYCQFLLSLWLHLWTMKAAESLSEVCTAVDIDFCRSCGMKEGVWCFQPL